MEVEEMVPLAYIYTIIVAFQGLFIFLIFVVLSKQVREAYTKCWRAKVNKSEILSRYFGTLSTLKPKPTNVSASNKAATASCNKVISVDHTVSKQSNDNIIVNSQHYDNEHSGNGQTQDVLQVLKNFHVLGIYDVDGSKIECVTA